MKHVLTTNRRGLTLIEILIYIGILGIVTTALVTFIISISKSKDKNFVVQEVNSNMRLALDVIEQTIRAATTTNTGDSTFDSDPGVLSLAMTDPNKNPTVINLSADDGTLQIKEASSSTVPITSSEVKITNFTLTDLTASSSRESVRVLMTIEFNNPSNDIIYDYALTTTSTFSIRQ